MKKVILSFLTLLMGFMCSFAQSTSGVEMAHGLRSSGKIYVVVLVLVVLFVGLLAYLISLDTKIRKLEKDQKS